MTNNERWYAVRTAPGAQRMASDIDGLPDRQRGESIVERSLRREGIDAYMPSFWKDVQHQRTNKTIGKRFPLLVGYVFVNIAERDFERVRRVDGVMCFLRLSPDLPPFHFREAEDIGALMLANLESKTAYNRERQEKERLAREHRRNALNHQLGLILPKGRRRKISMRYHAEQTIDQLSLQIKERVLLILKELEGLEADIPLANFAIAS